MSRLRDDGLEETNALDAVERQVVDFFVDGVKVLGLPRSIGEIYGLLFVSGSARARRARACEP